MPSTRSETKVNERVWEPSPKTVRGSPASAWLMSEGTIRPSFARIRGPYVLKIRTMRVSTPWKLR